MNFFNMTRAWDKENISNASRNRTHHHITSRAQSITQTSNTFCEMLNKSFQFSVLLNFIHFCIKLHFASSFYQLYYTCYCN